MCEAVWVRFSDTEWVNLASVSLVRLRPDGTIELNVQREKVVVDDPEYAEEIVEALENLSDIEYEDFVEEEDEE